MLRTTSRHRQSRRGVTLVEMLVTVALVVLIMTIIVNVFRSATGAVRGVQISQELESALRRLETTLRQDLAGATARFTPPLNPKDNLGYFEYGENSFADLQGEDADDWMGLTVKAPPGQPFQGRYWDPNGNQSSQPTIITSEFAEVLYFVRDGNLYRRVLLIVPDRQNSLMAASSPESGTIPAFSLPPSSIPAGNAIAPAASSMFGVSTSWQGMNDISAHPAPAFVYLSSPARNDVTPIPNSLGDLTNRENRIFRPRFSNDYRIPGSPNPSNSPDGVPDDFVGDATNGANGIPDFYPTLYPNAILNLVNESSAFTRVPTPTLDTLPFPFLFPGAYSVADYPSGSSYVGEIHGIDATNNVAVQNHSPLELGDNLATPSASQLQTYWGFPTWKETLSPNWTDPVKRLIDPRPIDSTSNVQSAGLSWVSRATYLLPPLSTAPLTGTATPYRATAQLFAGATPAGTSTFAVMPTGTADALWKNAWEDDLIMPGVRSFDIKAYDPNASTAGFTAAYYDLGYNASNWLTGFSGSPSRAQANLMLQTFGHEGRIPPLRNSATPAINGDYRPDAQWPLVSPDIGDNGNIPRLRRVWETWSTEYTNAPDLPLNPANGPLNGALPVYPSYPPPYPAPLRGIQIQIRLTHEPDGDRVKPLTITQDFSDKL